MEAFKDVLYHIKDIFILVGKWIGQAFSALFGSLGSALSNALPTFPAASKIFKSMNAPVIAAAILMYLLLVNFAAFLQFAKDKRLAVKNEERIPEKTLFKWCWAGGAAGGLLAMYLFHHKTAHIKFKIGVPLILILEMVFYSIIFGFLIYWSFDQ